MTKSKKILVAWVTLEIAATLWLGWEVARATETPWARQPKPPAPARNPKLRGR